MVCSKNIFLLDEPLHASQQEFLRAVSLRVEKTLGTKYTTQHG